MLNVLLEKLQCIWCSQKHANYTHDSPPGTHKIELNIFLKNNYIFVEFKNVGIRTI